MQDNTLDIKYSSIKEFNEITLPASKSVANRALIVKALSSSPKELINLSTANDTKLMYSLLNSNDDIIDVEDAGTTMRFLTAYYSVMSEEKTIHGTDRMHERPIGTLVDSLKELGAQINYLSKEGYPPLKIGAWKAQQIKNIAIKADISSQYISAIMMISPMLEQDLKIELKGKIGSRPYIKMTASVMKSFGADLKFDANIINIKANKYQGETENEAYQVEPDWSAASYWYSLVAIARGGQVYLKGLKETSIQGDHEISVIMKQLGVSTEYQENGIRLYFSNSIKKKFEWDFADCPDLAQTVLVVCAATGIPAEVRGLESLKIKETNRIQALKNELAKIGASLTETKDSWKLEPGSTVNWSDSLLINTYKDHRMAMAFAPLCLLGPITIEEPMVVKKSYPQFWEDFKGALETIKKENN